MTMVGENERVVERRRSACWFICRSCRCGAKEVCLKKIRACRQHGTHCTYPVGGESVVKTCYFPTASQCIEIEQSLHLVLTNLQAVIVDPSTDPKLRRSRGNVACDACVPRDCVLDPNFAWAPHREWDVGKIQVYEESASPCVITMHKPGLRVGSWQTVI